MRRLTAAVGCLLIQHALGGSCSNRQLDRITASMYWFIAYPGAPAGSVLPRVADYTPPKYSREACAAKWTGVISVSMDISETGQPTHLMLVGSDQASLGQAVIGVLKSWRFVPATLNGHPVETGAIAEFNFKGDQGLISPASVIRKFDPDWQAPAHWQRPLIVALEIDDQGRATNVRALQKVGRPWDDDAISAVRKWKFRPATLNGRPVPIETLITFAARTL